MGANEEILQRLDRIERTMSELYLPKPSVAEDHRPRKAIDCQRKLVTIYQDPGNQVVQGQVVWTSQSLETMGFTHQDAFLAITVFRDTLPDGVSGFDPLFTVELQGACGSPFCPLASFVVVSDGRPGLYTVQNLVAASNSLEVRVQVFAADNTSYAFPAPGRQVEFAVDGVLIAGYEM